MIEVDDSKLTDCHRDYLERWAKVLGVSVAELLGRILLVGIEGEVYCEESPAGMTSRVHERPKRLAPKLRTIRKHLGVSQTEMKRLLNFKGDYGRISDYELGKRQPTVLTLLAYSKVSGVSINDLVDDEAELRFD